MEKDLVSIIVPCYNVSRFLKDVFLSIQNQTYQNIETIFVDDGSTDDTGKLLDEFVKIHSKAKVIHKKNKGVSSARNTGLESARGKYIYFLDADDAIHPSTISLAYFSLIKYNADVVAFKFKRVSEKFNFSFKSTRDIVSPKIEKISSGKDETYLDFLSNAVCGRMGSIKFYSIESMKKMPGYPKVFNEQCFYGEDSLFLINLFKFCTRVVWLNEKLYYYRKVKTSAMHSAFKEKDLSALMIESALNELNPDVYVKAIKYVPSVICFVAMDLIFKLSRSDYHNSKTVNEIYHRYRDNLKYLPHLSRLPLAHRFGTLFTLPAIYIIIRKKLKG